LRKIRQKLERLAAFKAGVQKHHTVAFFKDANEAAWQILAALRKHELKMRETRKQK